MNIQFSTINDPTGWYVDDQTTVIRFHSPEDAKKAEKLLNSIREQTLREVFAKLRKVDLELRESEPDKRAGLQEAQVVVAEMIGAIPSAAALTEGEKK